MTFTPTPPTEVGFYAWKAHKDLPIDQANIGYYRPPFANPQFGLWCQLTCKASAQQRLAEEVEKAHREGWSHRDSIKIHIDWNEVYSVSRAARVAKGEE
jgi:hypothetical protein